MLIFTIIAAASTISSVLFSSKGGRPAAVADLRGVIGRSHCLRVIGLFIGPVVLAVTLTLLQAMGAPYRSRERRHSIKGEEQGIE